MYWLKLESATTTSRQLQSSDSSIIFSISSLVCALSLAVSLFVHSRSYLRPLWVSAPSCRTCFTPKEPLALATAGTLCNAPFDILPTSQFCHLNRLFRQVWVQTIQYIPSNSQLTHEVYSTRGKYRATRELQSTWSWLHKIRRSNSYVTVKSAPESSRLPLSRDIDLFLWLWDGEKLSPKLSPGSGGKNSYAFPGSYGFRKHWCGFPLASRISAMRPTMWVIERLMYE